MALWRDATAGALGPGQGDYDPYGDLSSLVRQIAPGIGTAAQASLQPQLSRPDDSFAAYMADPLARSDADIQQRAAAGPPSVGQSMADLGNMVLPYLAGAAPGGSLSSGIRAYHGSPYDFDAFDASKIGTGEGAQTFGHGLYFAESEPVARSYRDALVNRASDDSNRMLSDNSSRIPTWMAKQIEQYPQGHEYHGAVIDNLQTLLKERMAEQAGQWQGQPWMAEANVKGMQEISDHLARIKSGDLTFAPTPKGHMYEVDINADPQQFLNWDKPLTQQSTAVQPNLTSALELHRNQVIGERLANDAAARSQDRFSWFGPGNPAGVFDPINASGNSLPKLIRQMGPETATQTFQSSGIPGIRYLDQGSRGAGQGTSNYVVFDPKIIDILRKYAIPGLISGGAAAGATSAGGS